MEEILKTIAELPTETIETFIKISYIGVAMFVGTYLFVSLTDAIYETALEKGWRRHKLKFLSNEDIELINEYLTAGIYNDYQIGKIVINAYQKEKDLKKFKKQRWQKVKDFFKFKK